MPVETPLWMVAIAVVFGVVIGKEVFGGTGMNILNVALTTRAFLFFAHPNSMIGDKIWISQMRDMEANGTMADGVSGATPLGQLATMDPGKVATYYENGGVDFSQSLMGNYLGSIGETSVYAILLGLAFLLITRVASWRIVVSFFAGGLAMAFIFNIFAGDNVFMQVPALSQLMLGSFMFGMVFMITDPVTAAQTNKGKFYYGFLAGFIGILIRVANPAYPEGIMLGILIANVCASLIDHMVINANIKRREKRLAKATA
jgi:Na+-transporting NADH:ubiquinone oxidoreductase subunit B